MIRHHLLDCDGIVNYESGFTHPNPAGAPTPYGVPTPDRIWFVFHLTPSGALGSPDCPASLYGALFSALYCGSG